MAGFNSTGTFGFTGGGGGGGSTPTQVCSIASGTSTIDTTDIVGNNAVFYNFSVTDCTNYYAGNLVAVWDSLGNIQFTETATPSIGSTAGVSFTFTSDPSNINLVITVPSGDWKVTFTKTTLTDCCSAPVFFLTTESGDYITTESGIYLITE